MPDRRFEKTSVPSEGEGAVEIPESGTVPETVKLEGPKLRYITKALELLHPEEGGEAEGKPKHWTELYKKVKPFEDAVQLSDNIREVVRDFVAQQMPKLKEAVPSISELNDKELLDAVTNNWFEKIDEVGGERREVLLAVMAHVVKRIETTAYKKILEHATEEQLEKLGLDDSTRDLLSKILEVSAKADPLFIRFMAFAQLSGKPPEAAHPGALYVPGDPKPHTIGSVFHREAGYLRKQLGDIAANSEKWLQLPGGDTFKVYLEKLATFYGESDPEKMTEHQREIERLYAELLQSNFPILITPATEGYYKEPYFDPELKVSLSTRDAKEEESSFRIMQQSMADSLGELGVEQFAEKMKSHTVRSVVAVGSYGVNLTFNAVAQEKPAILLYRNEQIRAYDREFPRLMDNVFDTGDAFRELEESERTRLLEIMSRTNTMLHEFSHDAFPDGSPESARIGKEALTIIDEVKAEAVYRALIPTLVKKGAIEGTKEQWAYGEVVSSLQVLEDEAKDDPYFQAAVFTMNDLAETGVLEIKNDRLVIKDIEELYRLHAKAAREILDLYRDESMNERKAARWIAKRTKPNKELRKIMDLLKSKKETR